jgi:guanine nucleotide-binding protein subunit alpha
MKLIHDNGYNNDERESFKEIIFSNVIQSMRVLLEAMKILKIDLGDASNQKHVEVITSLPGQIEGDTIPQSIATAIKILWQDSGVKACFARSNEFQLNDSSS